jgi:uncharacterized repeat protein (TIGR03843 family)
MKDKDNLNLKIVVNSTLSNSEYLEFENLIQSNINNIYSIPKGSNNNLLIEFRNSNYAIFKPKLGERPLSDFPIGSLYKREFASYLFSILLGWPNIPPTTIVEIDKIGLGSLQKIISNKNVNYFDISKDNQEEFLRFAVFDYLTNNADRKAGHCILDESNKIWSIDHGVTFHETFKLRTIMFDIWENNISDKLINEVKIAKVKLSQQKNKKLFSKLISEIEINATISRMNEFLTSKSLPIINQYENIPWPLI